MTFLLLCCAIFFAGVTRILAVGLGELEKLAEQGNAAAQADLGFKYLWGEVVPRSDTKAFGWLLKAAVQGNAEAQNNLAAMYDDGRGVQKDEAKAIEWWQKAAAQGNDPAKRRLAFALSKKKGIARVQNNPKTYIPSRNQVQWFVHDPNNGKIQPAEQRQINLLNANAKGVLKIGNGTNQPAIGKLIDTFTDSKRCSFVILPKAALTLDHIPEGRYQLIYVFGDEIIAGRETFRNPSGFTKIADPFEFATTRNVITGGLEYSSWSITLHGVDGGTAKSREIEPKVFDQY